LFAREKGDYVTRINVAFMPLEGGNSVGLSSVMTIKVYGEGEDPDNNDNNNDNNDCYTCNYWYVIFH